jgi:hypothetical protein
MPSSTLISLAAGIRLLEVYARESGSEAGPLRAGNGGEIALLENAPVMQFVSGDSEGQRAHRHFVLVGDAAAEPGVSREPAQQSDTGAAHVRELLRQIGEPAFIKCAASNVIVLLKAFDRRLIGARDAHGPVREDAFRVAQMAENLFYRPFAWSVAKIAVPLAARGEKLDHLQPLGFKRAKNVVSGDQRDILFVMGRVFAGFRPRDRGSLRFHGHLV